MNNSTSPPTATGPVALARHGCRARHAHGSAGCPDGGQGIPVSSLASGDSDYPNLTVTIGNTNAGAITLTGLFPDTSSGMTINTAGNTGTCTGVTATAASSSFTMANS